MILVMITLLLLPVLLLLVVLCWQPRMTPRWIAAIFDAS
jgi:Na+/H+ antiporter NhaD/arsenite permease-like protein